MSATLWIGWKLPADPWDLGEGLWMLRWVGRGLEKKIGCVGISRQKLGYVFVVDDWL